MANFNNPFAPTSLADFTISDPQSKQQLESIVTGAMPFPLQKYTICLWGTYGTGKTTLAEMLPVLIEQSTNLRPSPRTSRGFVAQQYWHLTACGVGSNSAKMMDDLRNRASSDIDISPGGYFYEILDEVDMLTDNAQASLKSAISNMNGVIFILTTNHPTKLDKGVRDRSYLIEMNQPELADMEDMGRRFLRQMGLAGDEVPSATMQQLATASNGSIRDFGDAVAVIGQSYGGVIP